MYNHSAQRQCIYAYVCIILIYSTRIHNLTTDEYEAKPDLPPGKNYSSSMPITKLDSSATTTEKPPPTRAAALFAVLVDVPDDALAVSVTVPEPADAVPVLSFSVVPAA